MAILRSTFTVFTAGLIVGCGSSGDTGTGAHGAGAADSGGNGLGGATDTDGGSGEPGGAAGSGATGSGSGATGSGSGATGSGSGATGSGATGGAGGGGNSGTGGGPVTSVTTVPDANACATDKVQAQGDNLDLFIMEDRSGSMDDPTAAGDSKWTVITTALSSFVNDPQSAGIGAGIGFFGDTGDDSNSCDSATYASPTVPIAPLNGNAPAIDTAIQTITPGGNTPTEPALEGAIAYAQAWAQQHPTHRVIVIFATDGLPNGCNSSVQGSSDVAAAGVSGSPSISTYVIGVFGSEDCPNGLTQQCDVVQNTNTIARGGGTGSAFIVDTGGNTLQQFEDAMNAIRTANIAACQYTIPLAPNGKTIDPSRATVQYAPIGGTPANLSWMASAGACGTSAGWYYDDVNNPRRIHLCDATCTTVQADPNARIQILMGCQAPGGGGGTGGAGGSGGGGASGTGGSGGTGACLLTGQSCQDSSECCSGICTASGICNEVR